MGEKMNNAPVFLTLAQIRFNHFSKLSEAIPDIQEQLRLAHFPDFRPENVQVVAFQGGATNVSQQARFVFGNVEGTASFVLDNGSITFQTTDYDTYVEFSEMVNLGITILNGAVPNGLDYVSRLGIRYFDAVQPAAGETLKHYLITEVLGLSDLVPQLTHSFSETRSTSEHGSLLTKVIIRDGKLGLPAELAPMAPKVNERFEISSGRHAVIDSDAFNEKRQPFDLSRIMMNLAGLHDDINDSFKKLVTEHALESWK